MYDPSLVIPVGPLEITEIDNVRQKKKKEKRCTNVLRGDKCFLGTQKKSEQNLDVVNGLIGSLLTSISHGSRFTGSLTVGIGFSNVNHDLRQPAGNYLNCLLYWCFTDCVLIF